MSLAEQRVSRIARELRAKFSWDGPEALPVLIDAAEIVEKSLSLFDAIKHGDAEHQAWLKQAIEDHFSGRPVEPPKGKGTKEAEIERLTRLLDLEPPHCPSCDCGSVSGKADIPQWWGK